MGSPTPVSRKRVFTAESSSSGYAEVDSPEFSPAINCASKPKSSKQGEVMCHEIIEVDVEEEGGEVILTDPKAHPNAKGKEVMSNFSGGLKNDESESDTLTSKNGDASLDSTNVDDLCSDYEEDDCSDTYYDDTLYEVEENYGALESHFDNMDIPPGVEISFPWLSSSPKDDTKVPSSVTSTHESMKVKSVNINPSPVSNSSDTSLDNSVPDEGLDPNYQLDISSIWSKSDLDLKKSHPSTSTESPSGGLNFLPEWAEPHLLFKKTTFSALEFTNDPLAGLEQDPVDNLIDTSPVGTSLPTKIEPGNTVQRNMVEVLHNFCNFKKFDIVEDYSDHHYSKKVSSAKQPPKNWAKRIQEEWKILEKDLPDAVFVRAYESRMDLLRAVIIGAEGTPYHDGLFFFDVFFPSTYPSVPPHVHYHSRGLRINPNLYNCGKVCLSLLNTWTGSQKEKWIPGVSTTLQVLVSIQGLILNAKPFFNEPGFANMDGTVAGEKRSLEYNEKTFIYNLQTMVYNMRRPPKHFEDFAVGYFIMHGRGILVLCKAYLDGARVGGLVKGGVQDADVGKKSCSKEFKSSLGVFMTTMINQLLKMGAKDCDEFMYLTQLDKEHGIAATPSIVHTNLNNFT